MTLMALALIGLIGGAVAAIVAMAVAEVCEAFAETIEGREPRPRPRHVLPLVIGSRRWHGEG